MAHVDDQRVARVLDALEAQHPGAQLLVNDPWSIYYLTGFYADMFERFWRRAARTRVTSQ